MDLLDAMEHALHLAPNMEILDIERLSILCKESAYHQRAIVRIMNLIVECGYFIQTYTMDINFRMNSFDIHIMLIC